MLLTLDVGNTNIVIGAYQNDNLKFSSRIETHRNKMADEYAIDLLNIIKLNGILPNQFEGAIISTVVPHLKPVLKSAVEKICGCKVLVVSNDMKTGLDVSAMDNPQSIGADLICGAVGAIKKYPLPAIIFDFGTATTICAIDENKKYIGGSFMTGVSISLDALASRTAQLPFINLDEPDVKTIGTNTIDSMRSGIIIGTASMMDGMILRYKKILGENASVIATGGLSRIILPYCYEKIIYDANLLSDGLLEIYKMNI